MSDPSNDVLPNALLWQNMEAYETSYRRLLAKGDVLTSRDRLKAGRLLRYVGRYAAKNDSIGFYGPIAWARVAGDGGLTFRSGQSLVSSGWAAMEWWAVQQLAARLVDATSLRDELYPRVAPHVVPGADGVRLPFGTVVPLDGVARQVLVAADGSRRAYQVVSAVADGLGTADGGATVRAAMEHLARPGWLIWAYRGGISRDPLADLRDFVDRARPGPARSGALRVLGELASEVMPLPVRPGDPDLLAGRLSRVHERWREASGHESVQRTAKQAAKGRSAVTLAALRDLDVDVGRHFLDELRPALGVLIPGCGWLLHAAAAALRSELDRMLGSLADRDRGDAELVDLWAAGTDLWFRRDLAPLEPVLVEFQQRWSDLIGPGPPGGIRQLDPQWLSERVGTVFPRHDDGWRIWPYVSPDILVGDPVGSARYVLGELHLGTNTLDAGGFVWSHPAPDELVRLWRRDAGAKRPVAFPGNPELSPPHGLPVLADGNALSVLPPRTDRPAHSGHEATVADFVVRRTRGARWTVVDRARRSGGRWDLLEFLAMPLAAGVLDCHRPVGPTAHTPRHVLGPLVLTRERWLLDPADLAPLRAGDDAYARHLRFRRFAMAAGWPRYTFWSIDGAKPFPVDAANVASVDAGLHAATGGRSGGTARSVSVTEMLPGPGELWLRDRRGRAYVSELRLTAFAHQAVTEGR
jgi:hypothetical protein